MINGDLYLGFVMGLGLPILFFGALWWIQVGGVKNERATNQFFRVWLVLMILAVAAVPLTTLGFLR